MSSREKATEKEAAYDSMPEKCSHLKYTHIIAKIL